MNEARPFRMLFVCTANRCRSPMAEAIASDLLARRDVDAEVVSCGVMEGGVAASSGAVRAMHRRGLDVSAHVSHRIDVETVDAADLVLTMERQHVTKVAEMSMGALHKTFTVREMAGLCGQLGRRPAGTPVEDWIDEVHELRPRTSVLTAPGTDVEDPMGKPNRAYRRTADELEELLGTVVDSLFPAGRP